jgi:hypothetical protein
MLKISGAAQNMRPISHTHAGVVTRIPPMGNLTRHTICTKPAHGERARWHRELLRNAMEQEGFTVYPFEWWHYDYQDWRSYPIMNMTFEALD